MLSLARLFVVLILIAIVAGALIQIAEASVGGNQFHFFQSFYFAVTTLSTTGYGDLTAVSTLGRCVVISLMVLSIAIIPLNTASLINGVELAKFTGRFRSSWFLHLFGDRFKIMQARAHVVVFCPVGTRDEYIDQFLIELCRDDHGNKSFPICLMFSSEISKSCEALLSGRDYYPRLRILVGSVMVEADLQRAGVASAQARGQNEGVESAHKQSGIC
jgi:hypothetical protein